MTPEFTFSQNFLHALFSHGENRVLDAYLQLAQAFELQNESDLLTALPPLHEGEQHTVSDALNAFAQLGFPARSLSHMGGKLDMRLLPAMWVSHNGQKIEAVFDLRTIRKLPKGTIYTFVKTEANKLERNPLQAKNHWLQSLLPRFGTLLGQIVLVSIMLNLIALTVPFFVMQAYDQVIINQAKDTMFALTCGVAIALMIEWALRHLRGRVLSWLGVRLDYVVNTQVLAKLLNLPATYIERASVAAQIARLRSFESVRDFFTGPLLLTLLDLPFTALVMLALFILGGALAWVPVAMAVIYLSILAIARPILHKSIRAQATAASERQQLLIETYDKFNTIRSDGLTKHWQKRLQDAAAGVAHTGFRVQWQTVVLETIASLLFAFAGLALICWGVNEIWAGRLTVGTLIAIVMLSWRVLYPLQALCVTLPRLEQLGATMGQINRLMALDTEYQPYATTAPVDHIQGQLSLQYVGLRYNKEAEPVFAGLSFNVRAGGHLAITGSNGAGKSTILKLVNGLYRPQAGSVLIDGHDIRQWAPATLRQHLAYLSQNPEFMAGTILDNLRLANPLITADKAHSALQILGLEPFLSELPDGLNASVVDAASWPQELSYGLCIARLLLRDAPIYLIDEVPHAVWNSLAGQALQRQIMAWRGERTIIQVTHRNDHIAQADQALWLHPGERPLIGLPNDILKHMRSFQRHDILTH